MKTQISAFFIFIMFSITSHAQIKVWNDGKTALRTSVTPVCHFQLGIVTSTNSNTFSIGGDFRMCRYNSGAPWAFLQARDETSASYGFCIRTQYAGNIRNAVLIKANGDVECLYDLSWNSDARFKRDIKPFTNDEIGKLYSVNACNYLMVTSSDSSEIETVRDDRSYGIIAQDLRNIYPELVKEDDRGYLSINYVGLIPLLIEAVKDQKNTIDYLESELASLKSEGPEYKSGYSLDQYTLGDDTEGAVIFQNSPNPFNKDSEIRMQIPETVRKAYLYLFDLNGSKIKSYLVQERGNASVLIHGYELDPGMYLYTLIVDGDEVDTKRMILTD